MSLHDVYVGLGSNLNNPIERVKEAWQRLKDLPFLSDFRLSKMYKTQPISPILQPDFINAVGFFKTGVDPQFLLGKLQEIEIKMGKKPKSKEDPRLIDIDILFFGSRQIRTETLEIPHPRWSERLFVLHPLSDITRYIPSFDPSVEVQVYIEKLDQEIEVLT